MNRDAGYIISGIAEITLAATATDISPKIGQTFYISNKSTQAMYIGQTATACNTPGWDIPAGGKSGPWKSESDTFYARGNAGDKALILYVKDVV